MQDNLEQFYLYLQAERVCSPHTLAAYRNDIGQLLDFFAEEGWGAELETALSKETVRYFIVYLQRKGYSKSSITRKLSTIKSLVKFWLREDILSDDPLLEITAPKKEKKLPRFLYLNDVELLLLAPDLATLLGIRDRAILEFLYASGCRVGEMVGLNSRNLNWDAGYAKITGKGNKERRVFFGEPAGLAMKRYWWEARPKLLKADPNEPAFFLNQRGKRINSRSVRAMMEKYVQEIALQKHVSPHTLRHTFATHLLNGGADLRSVQELLGHVNLSTTQIYTHLTKESLKKIHQETFPRR